MSSWMKSEQYANMPHDQYLQTEEGKRYTKSENDWQQWQMANSPDFRPTQGGGQPQGGQQGGNRQFVQPFFGRGQQGGNPSSAPARPAQFAPVLPVQWQVDPNDSTSMINVADWANKTRGGNNGGGQQGNVLSPSGQPNYGGGQPQGGQSNYDGGSTRASSPFRQQFEQAQLRFGGQSNYTPPQQQYRPPAQYNPPAQQYSQPQSMSGNSYGQNYGQNYGQQTPAPSGQPSAQDQFRQSEQQRQQAGLDRGQQQRDNSVPRTAGGFGQVPRGYGQVPRGYGGYYGNSGNARPIQ